MGASSGTAFKVEAARKALPILEEYVYLQTGSYGIMAAPVAEKVCEFITQFDTEGWASLHLLQERLVGVREQVARLLGATADEIAFTDNVTHGVNLVFSGLEWEAGDEVIISEEEHPALLFPSYYLADRVGVQVRRFKVSADPEVVIGDLRRLVTNRTRLIATSHVSCLTGVRLPVRDICNFASERGVLTLLDGAQSVGVFPVDVSAIGCDFYAGNGHKWLNGPKGTGIFFARAERIDELRPIHIGNGIAKYPMPDGRIVLETNYKRFEYGTRHLGSFLGLGPALDWLESWGLENLEQHRRELTDYVKELVLERPNFRLHTPRSWNESSAMTSFTVKGVDGVDLREWLRWERKILTRRVLEISGLRVSTDYFNTKEDLDLLFRAIPEYPKYYG